MSARQTNVDVLELSRDDFEKHIKPNFPDIYQTIGDIALEHLSYVNIEEVHRYPRPNGIPRGFGGKGKSFFFLAWMIRRARVWIAWGRSAVSLRCSVHRSRSGWPAAQQCAAGYWSFR